MYLYCYSDIMKLYILALGHGRKLKFEQLSSSSMYKLIITVSSCLILCSVGEIKIFEHELFISALEHASILILNSYAWVI